MTHPTEITSARAGPELRHAPARLVVALVRLYQRTLSPVLPIVTMGACACRFSPTCSQYAIEAVAAHGAARGSWLALRRLLKCTPLHPGGFDPVPRIERDGSLIRKSRARLLRCDPVTH